MGDTDARFLDYPISEDALKLLFGASNSSHLEKSFEILIEKSKSDVGRSELATKGVLSAVLGTIQSAPYTSHQQVLSLCLRLLRNLCAGEIANQNSFVKLNGIGVLRALVCSPGLNRGLIRTGLQVLANVSLAGKEHQLVIWEGFYPDVFVSLARLRSKETCDPLCMIIYACIDGNPEFVSKLCSDAGWPIMEEIIRTASFAGFGDDWLKLLVSRVCLEESQLPVLFSKLQIVADSESECTKIRDDQFSSEQAFLMRMSSEIVNERIRDITVANDVALFVFGIFKESIGVLDRVPRGISGIPSGSPAVDGLGYSLTMLRDICAQDSLTGNKEKNAEDVVYVLLSYGLIELLLSILCDLEPPALIKKAMKQTETRHEAGSSFKPCPYKGFRRDVVSLIGNCAYKRKHAQDEIRQKNGILLLLQQCVTDEDNPFLREWGIWAVKNLLEGNEENQREVSEMQIQGPVDSPEIAELGLRVEIDQRTRRPKLVNIPATEAKSA